jgi:hypothetical protein
MRSRGTGPANFLCIDIVKQPMERGCKASDTALLYEKSEFCKATVTEKRVLDRRSKIQRRWSDDIRNDPCGGDPFCV